VYTGYRTKTIQRNWQHLCTQDTGRRQSRETGNICVHKIQDEDNPEIASSVFSDFYLRCITWQRNYKYSRFCFVEIRKSNHVEKSIYMYILIYDKSLVNL
jgi:hypothetical protein